MRPYALSIFIHGIVLALAVFTTWETHRATPAQNKPIYVEMISQPSSSLSEATKPQALRQVYNQIKKRKIEQRQKLKPQEAKAQSRNKDLLKAAPKNTLAAQSTLDVSAKAVPETKETSERSNPGTSPGKTKGTSSRTLSYAEELKVYLEKNKHYPRQALRLKQTGTVLIKVKIGSGGTFRDLSIANPSSSPILNQAAIDLFQKLRAFKPLPKDLENNSVFTIPIAYVMGG